MAYTMLEVQGADGSYPVFVAPGLLHDALPDFVRVRGFTRAAVVTNDTLAPLYGESLAARLPGGCLVTVPDGESHKTLDTLNDIYAGLLAGGADRGSVVIALGGGVVGDMAGFAAATFMRGVALIQAPTSLLAMVDSSIGGKVGVDLPQGKNLAGAFKDPLAVFADTATLHTLPDIEFRCGLAEVVKSALVGDPSLVDHLLEYGPEPLTEIITRAASVKIALVGRDRLESGPRAFLNLGHTFGHALEQVSGYAWKHGQGVALGLVAAARLSERIEECGPGLADKVEQALVRLGLPVRYSGYEPETLWAAMAHDKKWRGGAPVFVLLENNGQPKSARDVTRDDVIAVLADLREDT